MRLLDRIADSRADWAELKSRGRQRYFAILWRGTLWAEIRLRLGQRLEFSRSVCQAAAECEAGDQGPDGAPSLIVDHFEKCRAKGDRPGMVFWRSVGLYLLVSVLHGPEKIRIVDR